MATKEKAGHAAMIIYPNPVSERLSVRLENGARASLRLVDGLGRVVLERWVEDYAELQVGNLAKGLIGWRWR